MTSGYFDISKTIPFYLKTLLQQNLAILYSGLSFKSLIELKPKDTLFNLYFCNIVILKFCTFIYLYILFIVISLYYYCIILVLFNLFYSSLCG